MTDRSRPRADLGTLTETGRLLAEFSSVQRAVRAGAGASHPQPAELRTRRVDVGPRPSRGKEDAKQARQQAVAGVRLIRAGKTEAGIAALQRAAGLNPDDAQVQHDLGLALLQVGRTMQAAAALTRAAALDPSLSSIHAKLAEAFDRLGEHAAAIQAYLAALERKPGQVLVHRRLGELHHSLGEFQSAEAHFRTAASLCTGSDAQLDAARADLSSGHYDRAEALLRAAIHDAPNRADLHAILAQVLADTGRGPEAASSFEAAASRDPRLAGGWYGVAINRKFTPEDRPLLASMRAALDQPGVSADNRCAIHFAIGKALDDLGDYGDAMQALHEANRLRRLTFRFDRAALSRRIDEVIAATPPGFAAVRPDLASTDRRPILIVGMPRSGTTLLEQIVSSHPEVAAGGELRFWDTQQALTHGVPRDLTTEQARDIVREYLEVLRGISPDAARVTDKMPFNFFMLGLVCPLLPNATILHSRRNPIDTCLSIYSTHFAARLEFSAELGNLVFYYRQYLRLMEHWRTVLPGRLIEVDYEAVVGDPEPATREIIQACGLPWNDACLAPHLNRRAVTTASLWQARQPIYRTSTEKWRRYEPWLGPLRALLPEPDAGRSAMTATRP